MYVFSNIRNKFFLIILIVLYFIYPVYSKDIEVVSINYNLSSEKISCQLLVKNTSDNTLYLINPENYSCQELNNHKDLTIKSFSEKQLRGEFSFNEDNLNYDNPETDYTYSFYSEVKRNDILVLFFDIELNNYPFNNFGISSFLDYEIIKLQYLYSNKPLENSHNSLKVSEVSINSKIKDKKEFDLFNYIDNWDESIIFIK